MEALADLLPTLIFYLFSALLLASAVGVIMARNAVHCVFLLIFAFFQAAALFVLLGAEYLAMTLVIVYVGAVAVLFLFVVMMMNIQVERLREGFLRYLPGGLVIACIMLGELALAARLSMLRLVSLAEPAIAITHTVTNTHAIGAVLYTRYIFLFQTAGLVLLVAMIGAITLTLRHRPNVRRQQAKLQRERSVEESMEIVKLRSGQGA